MEASMGDMTRRTMLAVAGGAVAAAAVGLPRGATAQTAPQFGQQESVQDALKRLFGTRPIKDGAGTVKLDIPLIAENGAVVPVSVEAVSPMTAQTYVKDIYVIADKNRIPVV